MSRCGIKKKRGVMNLLTDFLHQGWDKRKKKINAHTKHVLRYRCKTLKGSLCFIYLYLTLRRNTRTFLADIINIYNFEVKIIIHVLMFQTLDDKFTRFFKALSKHNRKSKKCVFISPVNQMQDFIKNPEIFDINF